MKTKTTERKCWFYFLIDFKYEICLRTQTSQEVRKNGNTVVKKPIQQFSYLNYEFDFLSK
jgi:hypothetical protein